MGNHLQIVVVTLYLTFINATIFAQAKEWKTEKTNNGTITVKNRVSKRIGTDGKEEQLVEYVATTITRAGMKTLISIFKDVSKHREFMDQEKSIKVKTLSDYECVVYYFYKGFWPYPSSDIVAKMTYNEDVVKSVASFTLAAAPSLVDDKGVRRLNYYHVTYAFKDLGSGNVEITITSKFTPAVQLPVFMVSTWFPDGPADYLLGIIKLANAG
jgi:hypothetical protein